MLKITERKLETSDSVTLVLEGRLAGPWVNEADSYWRQTIGPRKSRTEVDLSGVSFVDAQGKALLKRMWQEGAALHATGCLMRCLVDEITGTSQSEASCTHENRVG